MRATKSKVVTLWVLTLLVLPFAAMPVSTAWTAGDEAAIFGHTFTEEYWTNSSIRVEGEDGTNSSFTASYVNVGEFSTFLIAFNHANLTDGTQLILPYQLFGMYFKTPSNQEVFIGAVFAFLLVHNETFGDNYLPDMGHDDAWYIIPVASDNIWPEYEPVVEPIPVANISENHYRFGMRYCNLTCRVVDANNLFLFLVTLAAPFMTVLISELVIQYDILIDENGEVSVETLYTLGQVEKLKKGGVEQDPTDVIIDSMEVSAVHYLSIFTSQYTVAGVETGTILNSPTDNNTLLDEDISIHVGSTHERAFDIGLGRNYALINESTDPWTTVSQAEYALNTLLAVRLTDLILVAWQIPFSAFLLAHMAYGLSAQIRSIYSSVGDMASHASTAFHNSNWWYAVTFPEWNGLRIHQDPVYTAYTNLAVEPSGGGVVVLLLIAAGVLAVVFIIRRRR